MANHKSALKRIRQNKKRALHNKYYAKTMRNAVRKFRALTDKDEAIKLYPTMQKMLDKLAKVHIIHKNKAANLKSSLALHMNRSDGLRPFMLTGPVARPGGEFARPAPQPAFWAEIFLQLAFF